MLTGNNQSHASALITNPDGSISLTSQDTASPETVLSETVLSETGGQAIAAGTLTTQGTFGGEINVLGTDINLVGATLNASGTEGGGHIRVGGNYQGRGPFSTATNTHIETGSSLFADAIRSRQRRHYHHLGR